jgi:hypothetical protein
MYLGSEKNCIRVLDTNKELRQLVLFVHEDKRTFTIRRKRTFNDKEREVTRITPDWNRYYLIGMDHVHLFISMLPRGAATVEGAREMLKPRGICGSKCRRQGEWFFVAATRSELADIDDAIKAGFIKNGEQISLVDDPSIMHQQRASSHVADEMVIVGRRIFVRGKITHLNKHHPTLKLNTWHSAILNAEVRDGDRRTNFID